MSRLDDIEARTELATPGPWRSARDPRGGDYLIFDNDPSPYGPTPIVLEGKDRNGGVLHGDDAEFIAHAREDVPWLLARVRELEQALSPALDELDDYMGADPEIVGQLRRLLALDRG